MALGVASAFFAAGCASMLRERVTPFPAGTRQIVPWQLNRELLFPVNGRIQFVVEVVEGHPPEQEALDDLVKLAARYGERPASWSFLGAPGTPAVRWERWALRTDEALSPDASVVFVRFVGWRIPNFGLSYEQVVGGRIVYVILVNQERHRRWRSLVLPERRLEEQTLVHEYGHLLGLPPAEHGYYRRYPDFSDGAHCVNPDCALTKPRFRSILYGVLNTFFRRHFLEDYCAACRKSIETAKAYWRALAGAPRG